MLSFGLFLQHKLHSSMISRCILLLSENSKKSSKQTKKITFSYLVKYNQWNNVVFNPASVEKIFQCVVFKQFRAVVVFLLKITQWIRYVKDSISYSYVISGFKPLVVPMWIICHGQNSRDIQNHSRPLKCRMHFLIQMIAYFSARLRIVFPICLQN